MTLTSHPRRRQSMASRRPMGPPPTGREGGREGGRREREGGREGGEGEREEK